MSLWAYGWVCVSVKTNYAQALESITEAISLYEQLAEQLRDMFAGQRSMPGMIQPNVGSDSSMRGVLTRRSVTAGRGMIAAMSDWVRFLDEVSWFVEPGQTTAAGDALPWTREPIAALPELAGLLRSATLTPVSVADTAYELLAWGPPDQRRGWLCRPPRDADGEAIAEIHRLFWQVCGGIVETFGAPTSWWSNQNEVLTADAERVSVADFFTDYSWIWDGEGLKVPINADDYYAVAVEANGNLTLAHRQDDSLLLFAPDHAFSGVTPLAGCPPYSLLTIDQVPNLKTWIELCAAIWRRQ